MVQNNDVSFSLFKQLALNVAVTVFTSRKLVKSCLNPKRISYSTELMVQMLSILSISDARNSHRLTLRLSAWMLMASCNRKERHYCRSFSLTIIIKYIFVIIPFLPSHLAKSSLQGPLVKECSSYLVYDLSFLYEYYHVPYALE